MREKPDAVKGSFLRTAFMTTTMGPSIAIDVASLQALKPAD
jgi:ribosomal protein L1